MRIKGEREGQGRISQLLSWAGPRTVVVPRSAQGFGFTLRHFVVYPPESATRSPLAEDGDGSLWQGSEGQGPEPLDTIFVKTVREGSTAHVAGLTAGDRIVAVNNEPVSGKSYAEVIALIHSSHRSLKLLVVPKDEDILQMAYQSQSTDSLSGSAASLSEPSVTDMQDSNSSSLHKTALQLAVSGAGSQRTGSQQRYGSHGPHHTYTFGMDRRQDDARGRREEFGRTRSMQATEDSVPRRTSREGPGRPVSQDSGMRMAGGIPSKAKYSFGLYFPPRHTTSAQSRTTSADNLSHTVPVLAERRFCVDSDASSSTSGSIQDGSSVGSGRDVDVLGRMTTSTPSPRQSYALEGSSSLSDYRRDGRYYVPVLNQSSRPSDTSTYSSEFRTRPSSDRPQRASVGSSVTVTSPPSATDRSHRSSLGSSLSRTREYGEGGGAQGHTTFVVRIPVSGTSTSTPQSSFGSSFALTRSPRHTTIDVQRSTPSHPTHIEVQTTPSSKGTHIVEVQRQSPTQRNSPGPLEGGVASSNGNARSVWQRKVLFENGQNENNAPPNSKYPSRNRSELDKLTNQRKFTSVASRMASFEKSSDEDGEKTPGRENTPPTHPQPAVKLRRVSIEQVAEQDTVFVEPAPSSDSFSSVTTSESFVKVDHRGDMGGQEEAATNISGSTPVRIFVSPTSPNVPSAPVVEIVPVCAAETKDRHPPISLLPTQQPVQVVQPILRESRSLPPEPTSYHTRDSQALPHESSPLSVSTQRPLSVHEWPRAVDVDWALTQDVEYQQSHLGSADGGLGSRPQRKTSYLSAVNAPSVRYPQTPSPEQDERDMLHVQHESSSSLNFYLPQHPPPSSVMSSSDSAVTFSRPTPPVSSSLSSSAVEPLPSVVLRKKTAADTVEDNMAKLHRRTSYLMATARDRSNNPKLEPSFSPFSVTIPEEPASTPVRQFSLNKLKNFFGEQTPSIMEATERSRTGEQPQPPESPLPDITRKGQLWCKTAICEGKKCSDRSWKQVWAVLRGHALFLIKDRRDGSTAHAFSFEEPPISIKSCLVDIAHDYSRKRKHVFRLTTCSESVYLLQAEDKGTMMSWIQAIKTNNNPDQDEEGIGSTEPIRRKVSSQSDSGLLQASPLTAHKAKKLAGISFKAKLPHSPSVRRKKPEESGGSKKGGWKGRIMPRSFKKQTTDDSALLEESEDISKSTFGIPLEDCFPSPNNEFVPLIVELCTRIVEVRGLEVVGVYRVPGNSVAVTHMQDELNRGIENMNMDNDKWLDVNVVSSLLKAFFRKLPQPLVTEELYDSFIKANRNTDPEKRMLKLKRLLQMMSEHHYETFKHLAEHLSTVAANGQVNKMDAKNLAIMFGPTLIRKVDDDTVSLVTDMCDQCRIVESVILHNEWFFSTWDQDHFVPVDSGVHTHPSALDTRVARDDDEDADSAINTKEIISSIVNAANKKLKLRQQNKSTDSLDFDTTLSQNSSDTITSTTTTTTSHSQHTAQVVEGGFQERSVDAAIARATIIAKSQSSLASSRSASEDCLDRHTTAPLATSEPDFLDWDERYHYAGRGRHLSDDALLERSDEVVGGWVGRGTLDWLKRLEQEARTIRRLEEQRQRDIERRRRQQQKIERELQRSQRDLEMEDAQSVEDLLAWSSSATTSTPTFNPAPTPGTSARPPYPSRPTPISPSDEASLSREYPESQRLAAVTPRATVKAFPEMVSGGKYFVSVANSRDSFLRPSSLENLVEGSTSQFPHTGSLENVEGPLRDMHTFGPSPGLGQGNGGLRHGSLDSLLDMIHHEHQAGGSSDSEDGSDLLTSLTTTFDQKLQILLNPKYRLSSRHARQSHNLARQSGLFTGAELPLRSAPVEGVEGVGVGQEWVKGRDGEFRDPSLHRAAKSDTKVGIASRFQWGSSAGQTGQSGSSTAGVPAWYKPLPDFRSFLSRTSPGGANSVMLTQPRKLNSGRGSERLANSSSRPNPLQLSEALQQQSRSAQQAQARLRPFSKSEKTEVNTVLARMAQRDGGSSAKDSSGQSPGPQLPDSGSASSDSGGRSRSGTEQSSSSSGSSIKTTEGSECSIKADSASLAQATPVSPPPQEKESVKKGKGDRKRRHTVGGVGDLDHFMALLAVSGQQNDPRPSAWDQLRPSAQAEAMFGAPEGRSLQAWMQRERLRGSTPNLLHCGLSSPQTSS
ncbi:hypothetical protein ACOMHN_022652 [Nucella lapillus]